jgi:precorrin-6B methylase 1
MTTKDFRIVAQSREIDGLKRQLEVVHPSSKRAQVNYNPQEQFADIKLLRRLKSMLLLRQLRRHVQLDINTRISSIKIMANIIRRSIMQSLNPCSMFSLMTFVCRFV